MPAVSDGSLCFIGVGLCLCSLSFLCLCAAAERRAPEDGAGACAGAAGLSRACHQRLPQPAGPGHPEQRAGHRGEPKS